MTPVIVQEASLEAVMAAVVELEGEVATQVAEEYEERFPDGAPRVYEWRPRGVPDLPCIYNWLAPSPTERHTVAHQRDTVLIQANCGVRWTDVDTEMLQLLAMGDHFRKVVDEALATNDELKGLPHRAERTGMVTASDRFNDVPVLVLQFTIRAELDRVIV